MDEPHAASLWLTQAINATTTAISQSGNRVRSDLGDTKSMQSRLWWSILLRDRSLSLGLRRKSQILSFELTMRPDLPNEESFQDEIYESQVYDSRTKRILLTVFREQCQLAVILTKMLSIVFGTHRLSFPILSHESFHDRLAVISTIKTSLASWEKDTYASSMTNHNVNNAVTKFTNLTMMYYQ